MSVDSKQVSWIALAVSITALVLALAALFRAGDRPSGNAAEVAQEVYNQILAEVWKEAAPVYREMGVRIDAKPKSFRELLGPMRPVMKGSEAR